MRQVGPFKWRTDRPSHCLLDYVLHSDIEGGLGNLGSRLVYNLRVFAQLDHSFLSGERASAILNGVAMNATEK